MNDLLADVHALAVSIGPRGTGTTAERAAADFVADRLAALGLSAWRSEFRATASQNAFPLASAALALFAVAVYPLAGRFGRATAAGLALPAGPLLWRAIRLSTNALSPLLAHVRSGNVVARAPSRRPPRRRVVLLAHLDTNRARLAWRSGAVRRLEPLTWLTLSVFALLGLLYAAAAVQGSSPRGTRRARRLRIASFAPAAYIAATVVTLFRDERTPFSPGAHDNAASVAVALETARGLALHPLDETEVWLAFTGAEETDHAGLYDVLKADREAMCRAVFIGLEGLGSGDLVYLTRQGLCDHVRPDAGLLAVVEAVAARRPDLQAGPAEMTEEDEVTTLRRRGFRAICLAGRDPATGTLPHWHTLDDTAASVSAEFLRRSADFVRAVLDELDETQADGTDEALVANQEDPVCALL